MASNCFEKSNCLSQRVIKALRRFNIQERANDTSSNFWLRRCALKMFSADIYCYLQTSVHAVNNMQLNCLCPVHTDTHVCISVLFHVFNTFCVCLVYSLQQSVLLSVANVFLVSEKLKVRILIQNWKPTSASHPS